MTNQNLKSGAILGASAYLFWGFSPIYFSLLAPATSDEVIASRVLFSLLISVLFLTFYKDWKKFTEVFKSRKLLAGYFLAGFLLYGNWLGFTIATISNNVLDSALGYFINPILTVALSFIFLKERITRLQTIALALGCLAMVIVIVEANTIPWIPLLLATTFGLYSLLKKKLNHEINPISAASIEATLMLPLALVHISMIAFAGSMTFFSNGLSHMGLLAGLGLVTIFPIILFNAASQKINLSILAMLQYINPICQFSLAVFVFKQEISVVKLIAFAIIWCAIILLAISIYIESNKKYENNSKASA